MAPSPDDLPIAPRREPLTALALLSALALLAAPAVRAAWHRWRAPQLPPAGEESLPTTILLPVRDEQANVVPCVQALLAQGARSEVLVVDDGSSDRTAELVRELELAAPNLRLVAAGPLPAGWGGKVHALAVGAERAATPWLLATDADTRHHPDLLARALAGAAAWNLDALSLAGRQEARGLESLLTSPVYAVLDVLLGDWRRAAAGGGPAVANGQFILIRTSALAAIGGFAAVRGAALDDVALARALRAAGFRTGFARARKLLAVRMYQGARATWSGWRRNLGLIFGPQPRLAAAVLAALAIPPLLLVAALATGNGLAAAILWSTGTAASALFRHGQEQRLVWAVLYPADAILTSALLAIAIRDYAGGRLTAWKGRAILRAPADGTTRDG